MQVTTTPLGSNPSVFDVFGGYTRLAERKQFHGLHSRKRMKYDKLPLVALKEAARACTDELTLEYIKQNIAIIQLSRGIIS